MKTHKNNFDAYKGYTIDFEVCLESDLLHGRIGNIKDVVTFHGKTPKELYESFKEAVDDYLETCLENGEEPDKPFSGFFNIRTSPDVHRKCVLAAKSKGESLNSWASLVLDSAASRQLHS